MAKSIPSPYLPAPPTRTRAVGDVPNHVLYSLEDDLIIIPFFFTTNGGNLGTQQVSARCWVEQQSLGEMRLYHPYAQAEGTYVFLSRDASASYLVDKSTAPQGYTTVTIGTSTATWEGYLAFRGTLRDGGFAEMQQRPEVPLQSRSANTAHSPVSGLTCGFYGFIADASADPAPSSYFGSGAFNVSHDGDGEYTFHTTVEFDPSFTFIAEVDGLPSLAFPGTEPNQIRVTTKAGGVPSDPLENAVVRVLVLGPTTQAGKKFMVENIGQEPRAQHVRDGVFCAQGLMRDLVFIPIAFRAGGDGSVDYDHPDTVIPDNVSILKVGDDYQVEFGKAKRDTGIFAFHSASTTSGTYSMDTSTIETDGYLTVLTGAITDETIHGFIVISYGSEI